MKYVLAMKREHRDDTDKADWMLHVSETPGVTQVGDVNFGKVLIEAGPEAARELNDRFGDYLHIEPIISHTPIDKPDM